MKVSTLLNHLRNMPPDAEVYLKVQSGSFNGDVCWSVEDLEAADLCDYGEYQAVGLYGKGYSQPEVIA